MLQRTCACGQHTLPGGECESCRNKRLSLQRSAVNHAEPASVPSIVHDVLRSPGQPLDTQTGSGIHSGSTLRIGQPQDTYEREADSVSESVMRAPEDRVAGGAAATGLLQRATTQTLQRKLVINPTDGGITAGTPRPI